MPACSILFLREKKSMQSLENSFGISCRHSFEEPFVSFSACMCLLNSVFFTFIKISLNRDSKYFDPKVSLSEISYEKCRKACNPQNRQ